MDNWTAKANKSIFFIFLFVFVTMKGNSIKNMIINNNLQRIKNTMKRAIVSKNNKELDNGL
jgi:hypothetical protein